MRRDISLLGGGFNVGSHDRPDVQQQWQQPRVRPPRIGLIIGGAGRLRRLRVRLRRALGLARCGPSGAACNHNSLTAGTMACPFVKVNTKEKKNMEHDLSFREGEYKGEKEHGTEESWDPCP
ncbi:uncharacterized protein LOC144606281 [Rhinoraja longicauda]